MTTTAAPTPSSPFAGDAPSYPAPELLEMLNDRQREAVTTTEGPLLVLAGAGTGKTRVLITRIAHLIENLGVHPSEVLGITFTKKAAHEMRVRLADMVDEEAAEAVTLGTFHALGVRLLREYGGLIGLDGTFGISDEADSEARIRTSLKAVGEPLDREGERPHDIRERLTRAKVAFTNEMAHAVLEEEQEPTDLVARYRSGDADAWERLAGELEAPSAERFTRQFAAYQESLMSDNVVDYQDLISLPLLLLLQRPELLRMQHDRWTYLLVDEYQDTDHTQDYLLRLLTGPDRNLCVVGDDDQAIYSWRGARVENIRTFPDRWAPCEIVKLEQNYRSTGTILEAANAVLEGRPEVHRHPKRLWTEREDGDPVRVWTCPTQEVEGLAVARDIRVAEERGWIESLDDVLILYRINALSRTLEDAFRREGLPYRIVSGTALHDRKEVRDLLAYLKVVRNPHDFTSFERAATNPSRGIGPVSLDHLVGYARSLGLSPREAARQAREIDRIRAPQAKALEGFAALLDRIECTGGEDGVAEALHRLLRETGLRTTLIDELLEYEELGDDPAAAACLRRIHDLDDFLLYAEEFVRTLESERRRPTPSADAAPSSIGAFLDDIAALSPAPDRLSTHRPETAEPEQDAVTLMSVHAAKGLEAPRVYVVGLEEQVFPVTRDDEKDGEPHDVLNGPIEDEEMAEEARLFYVALTRAGDHLILSASRTRELNRGRPRPMLRSRFLSALPETIYVHNDRG